VIDLHCHLLPGIDDGPADLAGAIQEAQAQVAAGVVTVVCTPHVSHGYRNTAAGIVGGVGDLRTALGAAGVALDVRTGAEVSLARALELDDDELTALHLGGGPYLLLEPPLGNDVPRLADLVRGLQTRGHRILIAHPERCAAFHQDDELLGQLVESGALAQVTAGSLAGHFGRTVQKLATSMVDRGLIHVASSDSHDHVKRAPGLRQPLLDAGYEPLAAWLTEQVPSAILTGAEIPARPVPVATRKRGLFRR
jgi:protein-tyrosine phosphatase